MNFKPEGIKRWLRERAVSPHDLGPVPENLHADVAGAVSLRRHVDLAEFGLFEG